MHKSRQTLLSQLLFIHPAMASTLAQQLHRIAAKSVNTVSAEKRKALYAVSLLFPASQAATQDLTTVYSIALEGFRELVDLDPAFRKFERGLFSPTSIEVDRFVQSKSDNAELDRNIDEFLGLVGQRLLLKGAIKALEWLIRKFRIHEQNTASLILAFLPYHGHPLFARLLSIIPLNALPMPLSFLAPHLKPPTCPPRASIIKSLTAHGDFFNMLSSHVLTVLTRGHADHALISFYTAVTVETLNRMCGSATYRKNPEDIILKIMPVLIQGLKARRVPEFQIGCYMIITVLAAKLPLDDQLLDSLMSGVVEGWSKESISPALACVALLAQERKPGRNFPIEVVKGLSKVNGFGQMLVEMGQKYRVDELAAGLAIGILSQRHAFGLKIFRLVQDILLNVNMPYARRKDVLIKLLQSAIRAEFDDEEVRAEVSNLLIRLAEGAAETQQASKIMQDLLKSENFDIETLELKLQAVIKPAVLLIEETAEIVTPVAKSMEDPKTIFEGLLLSLPQSSSEGSFLSPVPSSILPTLSKVFLHATMFPSDTEMDQLFDQPLFTLRSINEAFTLSFLIKIWASKSYPILARAAALSQANKIIVASTQSGSRVDYQALLPYVLIALADQSKKVRAEAGNTIVSIFASLRHVESARKKDKATPTQIWGFDSIFGKDTKETEEAKWMDTTEARRIIHGLGIVGVVEEAIVDKAVVGRVVAHGLGNESMKNSLKATAMTFLASHVIGLSDLFIKLELLRLVNAVTTGAAAKAKPTVTILKDWVNVEDYTAWTEKCTKEKVDVEEIEKEIVRTVGRADKGEGVELLIETIKGSFGVQINQIGGMRRAACGRLQEVWTSLKEGVQANAAENLLDVGTASKDDGDDIAGEALDVLKQVSISMEVFEKWLQESLNSLKTWTAKLGHAPATANDTSPSAKRAKASTNTPTNGTEIVGVTVHRLTVVLELLEARSIGEKDVSLLKLGFGVLGEVMNVAGEIGVGVGYLLQLILGILSGTVNYIKTSDNPTRKLDGSIRADVLVNCIRSSPSPQVQNCALLLVAALADVAPEVVLHSVMPIFTFMGANVLRQDDEYSAHVIEQTVQRVIPPLVKSLHRQSKASSPVGVVGGVSELLSSFVTAYKHIPAHRRLRLFIKLTDTLGANEFLFVVLAMVAWRYFDLGQATGPRASRKEQEIVTFGKGVVSAFGEETQLLSVVNYLDIIGDVLHKKPKGISHYLFDNVKDATTEERITIAHKLLWMLASVLESEKLRSQVGRRLAEGDMDSERLRSHFSSALEKVLALGTQFPNGDLHEAIGLVMERLLGLLSTPEFVKVIETLLTESQFRRSALATFKDRVASEFRSDSASRSAVLNLTPKIAAIVSSSESPVELKADALSCISAITTKHGKREPGTIFSLAEAVIGDGGLRSSDEGLRVLALVCLTDMTACLAGRILPIVPKTVLFSLELLENRGDDNTSSRLVHNAVFAFLEALVSTIPSFMTSYLHKILKGAWASTVDVDLDEDSDEEDGNEFAAEEVTQELRTGLLDTIVKKMDLKPVMTAMAATWKDAIGLGVLATKEHLATVKSLLSSANKSQVQKIHPLFASFFLQAFDLRKQMHQGEQDVDIDEDEIEEVEELCLSTALLMVMKLNDTVFKPMFLQFVDWAADDVKEAEDQEDKDAALQRSITFYNFLNLLSENLKSLITEYYSFILTSSITLLTATTTTPSTPTSLKAFLSVLTALTTSFTNDNRDFWTSPTHFNPLSTHLLTSLTHLPLSPTTLTHPLITSIVELASACTGSEEQLKSINNSVLKHMHDDDVEVRLAAVKLEMALYEKLGDEWLTMLPETVPHIAELLEDDDEDVERETQRWIKKVEEYLGEGELEAMLT